MDAGCYLIELNTSTIDTRFQCAAHAPSKVIVIRQAIWPPLQPCLLFHFLELLPRGLPPPLIALLVPIIRPHIVQPKGFVHHEHRPLTSEDHLRQELLPMLQHFLSLLSRLPEIPLDEQFAFVDLDIWRVDYGTIWAAVCACALPSKVPNIAGGRRGRVWWRECWIFLNPNRVRRGIRSIEDVLTALSRGRSGCP